MFTIASGQADRPVEGPVCAFCRRPLSHLRFQDTVVSHRSYRVLDCPDCRISRTDPLPSEQDMERFYATQEYRREDGKRFVSLVEGIITLFTRSKARRITRFCRRGSILDIGCGRGSLLAEMKRRGWQAVGAEFNEETAAYAKLNYGIDAIPSAGLDGLPAERFDVVTLFHVLEHAARPDLLLASALRLLRQKGIIIIAVPNLSSLQALFGREDWFHLDVPYHLHHFTQEGLLSVLRNCGLEIRNVRQFDAEQNPFGWLQTLLNRSGIRRNLLYAALRRQDLQTLAGTGSILSGVMATLLLLPVYIPLAFVLACFESFVVRRGGTIEIVAGKTAFGQAGSTAR